MKAGVFCAAITLCYLIMLGVLYIISRRSVSPDMPGSGLSSLTIDFLSRLDSPVLLISDEDTVAWYNRAFSLLSASGAKYGAHCGTLLEGVLTLDRIKAKEGIGDASPITIEISGKTYSVSCYKTELSKKDYYLTIWNDISELSLARRQLKERNVLVCYIVVDNMSEITQGHPGQLPGVEREDRRDTRRMGRFA